MSHNLEELLLGYANRGLVEWQNCVSAEDRQIICGRLGLKIAENKWQIQNAIRSPANSNSWFIPMPKVNHRGIKHCFFIPIGSPYENEMKFELFLVVDEQNCLGFRFEAADSGGTHNYSHVQITPQMTLSVKGIPLWLPESYPAFQMGSSEPLDMFLYMATSVHGYGNGMQQLIQEIFEEHPTRIKKYLAALAEKIAD